MRVHVEFQGISRIAAGVKETTLEVAEGSTFRDVVRMVGEKYPALVGNVIQADGDAFEATLLDQTRKRIITAAQMDEAPQDGDRITFMSVLTGG
ncbi:MAG: MoaD/ThiS family protein [Anaerolineales bacterium]|nr:MoaD/ThiS family protein [Anaerolineales bacterium]